MASQNPLAAALERVLDPVSGHGLISARRAAVPRQNGGTVDAVIDVSGLDADARDAIEQRARAELLALPGVQAVRVALTTERSAGLRLIAVASGKGGVGKSTVAANLAIALLHKGI